MSDFFIANPFNIESIFLKRGVFPVVHVCRQLCFDWVLVNVMKANKWMIIT